LARIVKISVRGHGPETDAPAVEDAIDELRDYLDIFRGVEEAVAGAPTSAVIWRMVDARRSSPLAFDIQAFPRYFATDISDRVEIILTETARGMATLQARAERPRHFTNSVMRKVHRVFQRVTDGLILSEVDFGAELPPARITPTVGRNAARNVELILPTPDKPYQEIGSIEAYVHGAALDGFRRRVLYVTDRITVRDLWRNRRVQVSGRIHFVGSGKIDHLDVQNVRFLRNRSDLPQVDDIIDPDFTGGMRSEEYLERLRDGTLS
jgi:hypothetical protein